MARADHISVPRLRGLFVHHGIDCGDGTVIHYTGASWSDPRKVRRTTLAEFARDGEVTVRDYREFFARLRQPENLPRRMRIFWEREMERLAGEEGGAGEEGTRGGNKPFSPDAVIRRAESRLGRSGFDIMQNNCEHFATWCKTGIKDSEQVYAVWRKVLGPVQYMGLRRSHFMTALFEDGPSLARARRRGRRAQRR